MTDIVIGIFATACVMLLFVVKMRAAKKIRRGCSHCKSCKNCAALSEIDKNQIYN